MPLFSIITVTRNNLEGLRRTYESLAAQSFQGFEWLVVDGASDDGTVNFLTEAQADFTSEPDDGIYDAMNKGIERANGFFVLFLNAGDTLAASDTLLSIAAYIEQLQETPDFIYGDALEEVPDGEPAYKAARPYKKITQGMFTHHQAMLYRRDKIDGLRYDQFLDIAADYKFTLQYLEGCGAVVYCPFPLCLFESGGISQQRVKRGRQQQFKTRKELRTVSPPQNVFVYILQTLAYALRRIAPALYWLLKRKR